MLGSPMVLSMVAVLSTAPSLASGATPERVPYDGVVLAGHHLVTQPNLRVVWAGLAVFALGYVGAAVTGGVMVSQGGPVFLASLVPVGGPLGVGFFALGARVGPRGQAAFATSGLILLCAGGFEVVGAVLAIVGLVTGERFLEKDPPVRVSVGAPGSPLGLSFALAL